MEPGNEYDLFNHENPEGLRALYSGIEESDYLFYTSEDGEEVRIPIDAVTSSQLMAEQNHDLWYIEEVSENAYMSNNNRTKINRVFETPNRPKKKTRKSHKARKSRKSRKARKSRK